MMNDRDKINRVTVKIYSEEYVIKGNAEGKYIEKVATYVDHKMNDISRKNPGLNSHKVAVLAAVNISDEYLRLKADYEELIKLLDEEDKRTKKGPKT